MYFLTLPDSNNQGKREEAFHWRESDMNRKAGNAGLPVCMPYIETQIWEEEAPWVVGEGEITAKKPAIRLYSGHRCVTPLASGWRSLNWAQNRQTEIGWERGEKSVCVMEKEWVRGKAWVHYLAILNKRALAWKIVHNWVVACVNKRGGCVRIIS